MNIMQLVDISMPTLASVIDFYTVDPNTLSFVRFGDELVGSDNFGKILPLYLISSVDILKLTLTGSSSSNIEFKIAEGNIQQHDFFTIQDNNTIEVNNILSHTPIRLTVYFKIKNNNWDTGNMEILWSY